MPFQKGDVVECVLSSYDLTRGKRYEVLGMILGAVSVVNDHGLPIAHSPGYFQPAVVRKGDTVECIDDGNCSKSLTKGRCYEVLNMHGVYCDVTDDRGRINAYLRTRFKLVLPAEEPKVEVRVDMKVGDVVECIDTASSGYLRAGDRYEVLEIKRGMCRLKADGINHYWYRTCMFGPVPVTPDIEVKVGDTVKCVSTTNTVYLKLGALYKVLDISDRHYRVHPQGSIEPNWYRADLFVPVAVAPVVEKQFEASPAPIDTGITIPPKPGKFKAGDLVKCVHADTFGTKLVKGWTYRVAYAEGIFLRVEGQPRSVFREDRFVAAPLAPDDERKFKIGDYVKCNHAWFEGVEEGAIYCVRGVSTSDFRIRGRLIHYVELSKDGVDVRGNGSEAWFEAVPKPATPAPAPAAVKVGDVVVCVDGSHSFLLVTGKRYVVHDIDASGNYYTILDDDGGKSSGWWATRFKPAPLLRAGDVVECIDDEEADIRLTEGNLYIMVEDETKDTVDFKIVDEDDSHFYAIKKRFRKVMRSEMLTKATALLDAAEATLKVARSLPG